MGYYDSAYIGIGNPNLGLVANAWASSGGLGDDILGIGDRKGLYNGNIAYMLVNVPQFERQEPNLGISGFAYQYDQLHRIRQSIDYRVKDGKNWEKADLAKTAYTYDPNGNILTLQRTAPNAGAGSGSTDIDDLSYQYSYSGTNRLSKIKDSKGATHAGFGDLADQVDNNYAYNAIGQLGYDASQSIYKIFWTIQGKVSQVVFSNGNPTVDYTYDPLGNRLTKKVADTITYYIRDAQGNSFATYKKIRDNINNRDTTRLIEQYLYASSRLGVRSADIIVKIRSTNALLPDSARCFSTAVGAVSFEQTNHLGDVVVTLSDKVLGADVDADNAIDYYKSIVKSASLTYPFGWDIPNRKYSNAPDYRFGFNGTEKSPELGEGHNTTFFRENDTRIARWWSLDPKPNPSISHYAMLDNNPIMLADLLGDIPDPFTTITDKDGKVIHIINDGKSDIYRANGDTKISDENLLRAQQISLEILFKFGDSRFEYMGQSLHTYDFVDGDLLDKGIVAPGRGASIDFSSTWASDKFGEALSELIKTDPVDFLALPIFYGLNARNSQKYDLKTQTPNRNVYYGSLFMIDESLNGERTRIYASGRSTGNFLAGVITEATWMNAPITKTLYGVYQDAKTLNPITFIPSFFKIATPTLIPAFFGEQIQSGMSIEMGGCWWQSWKKPLGVSHGRQSILGARKIAGFEGMIRTQNEK